MTKIPITLNDYQQQICNYEDLASKVEDILLEILDLEKINFVFVEARVKSIESFQSKLQNLKSKQKELYDLSGIRIVGYVKSDVDKITTIIKKNFNIDKLKSKDKSTELKADQFGYRAIHLVGVLPDARIILPEYKKFEGMYFEIQIKTILEHGWAQIEHDRNYKYKVLPKDIQHDFYLVAGILESADNQFDLINKRIESFTKSVKQKTDEGKLEEIEIVPATFRRYMIDKFENQLNFNAVYGGDETGNLEMKELLFLNITNLKELDLLIPKNFSETCTRFSSAGLSDGYVNLSFITFTILFIVLGDNAQKILCETRNILKSDFKDKLDLFSDCQKTLKTSSNK